MTPRGRSRGAFGKTALGQTGERRKGKVSTSSERFHPGVFFFFWSANPEETVRSRS